MKICINDGLWDNECHPEGCKKCGYYVDEELMYYVDEEEEE
jgi:hypothetical protein